MKARIRQNAWGNWYGYVGSRRVEQFFNSSTETQEQAARRWLAEQEAAPSTPPAPTSSPEAALLALALQRLSDEQLCEAERALVAGFGRTVFAETVDEQLQAVRAELARRRL